MAPVHQRDPYEVLGVTMASSDQEIKRAYRRLALKNHPDKNNNDPSAAERFKEIASSYGILSDPERRRHFDTHGFGDPDDNSEDFEIDLSTLTVARTIFYAGLTKLGFQLKTSIAATVLDEAEGGAMLVRLLPIGRTFSDIVAKESVKYFGVTINKHQARGGLIVKVSSFRKSRFKLLYFKQRASGGCDLAQKEESERYGRTTTAGMYYLEGLQPGKLPAGTHVFGVYGDNFLRPSKFVIEALCARSFEESVNMLKENQAQVLEVSSQAEDEELLDELLRERAAICASITTLEIPASASCFSI